MKDIIVPKPNNRFEWMEAQWNHALTSTLAKRGRQIPVMDESEWLDYRLRKAKPHLIPALDSFKEFDRLWIK